MSDPEVAACVESCLGSIQSLKASIPSEDLSKHAQLNLLGGLNILFLRYHQELNGNPLPLEALTTMLQSVSDVGTTVRNNSNSAASTSASSGSSSSSTAQSAPVVEEEGGEIQRQGEGREEEQKKKRKNKSREGADKVGDIIETFSRNNLYKGAEDTTWAIFKSFFEFVYLPGSS